MEHFEVCSVREGLADGDSIILNNLQALLSVVRVE